MHALPGWPLLLNWQFAQEGAIVCRVCKVGWSFAERVQRACLRRHALLSAALDGAGCPRPLALQADAHGLLYRESLDLDAWPETLAAQATAPAPQADVLALALALGRVLQSLERHGIVHGRLSPETVLWQPVSAQAWLTDLDHGGFVRATDPAHPLPAAAADLAALGGLLAWRLTGDRSWLRKIRPLNNHDYHFHVRLNCPAGSICPRQTPIPAGDGCADAAEWVAIRIDPSRAKPSRPDPNYRHPRTYRMSEMPAQCSTVAAAP